MGGFKYSLSLDRKNQHSDSRANVFTTITIIRTTRMFTKFFIFFVSDL
ncbi:Uncharacterised protein [Myroides odoratimimus]|uniref:Uncharacterized protein n=1 Tax=Myroides odoratimimus CCUG 10230 TaxID=883150 RepID=A0ABP2NCT8_9FLAO|nr:hypothetical protein HMPREF9712_01566 [Myroides odoratimimus CCUG 10230]STZ49146.1 Uncharacterised protein [Myroides odoratimimus]